MNGFKRASRRQAAVVGLAVLMGASLFGCHAGPRLFSKKDRDRSSDKQELAEKDKGKFINRKKVRPESEYRDDTDERVAKSDSKPKPKSKPTETKKNSATESVDRAIAARRQADDAADDTPRSTRSTTNAPKSSKSKSADRTDVARRNSTKRPVTDLLNDDPLVQDVLPETRTTAKGISNGNSTSRSTAAKSKLMDEDPFKNSVIGTKVTKRPEKSVATVNFLDDDDLNDEMDDEANELEVARLPTAKTAIAKTGSKANSLHRHASAAVPQSKQKFLDETEEPKENSFRSLIGEETATVSPEAPLAAPNPKTVKRSSDAAKTVAGQKVLDRRKDVQQTLNDWRRELDSDESLAAVVDEKVLLPTPATTVRKQNPPAAKGHLELTTIEEFTPPLKSQGAVLDGELIIDTKSLPTRFQRTPGSANDPSNNKGAGAKVNSNSGASIDIVPGATQNRARSSGQISLQSLTQEDAATELTTAAYEPSHSPDAFGKLPSLKLEADSETGPKLSALEEDPGIAPGPPGEISDSISGREISATSTKGRAWKRALLVFAAMASAVGIAIGLRRRMELIPEPVRVPK